jgi:hypothetical protein
MVCCLLGKTDIQSAIVAYDVVYRFDNPCMVFEQCQIPYPCGILQLHLTQDVYTPFQQQRPELHETPTPFQGVAESAGEYLVVPEPMSLGGWKDMVPGDQGKRSQVLAIVAALALLPVLGLQGLVSRPYLHLVVDFVCIDFSFR